MSELERLHKQLASGRISRREFMSRMAALGVVAAVPGSLLSTKAKAATGGHLKAGIGAGSTTDLLDPATSLHTYTQNIDHAAYNYLTEIKADGSAEPELAESIEPSADAVTWRVNLRKDIVFHNGKTLDPDDVIASYQHHMGEDSQSAAKSLLEQIKAMTKDGNSVVFELNAGNADFPFIMSDYHIGIMPAKDGKLIDPNSGVGTGGYSVKRFDPGVVTELERNPNYWKEGRAHFDAVTLLAIKDVAARTNALTTGEIHVMDRCDLKTVHLLKRNKGVDIHQATGTQHYSIPMITTAAPFENNDVRLALKYAIDRETILKTILRGYGAVGNDHPIGPSNKYYNAELPQRPYDPDKAKFHLKKAGMENLKVDLSAADAAFAGAVDAAVLYKEHAAKAGIDIKVIREPSDGYWSNVWMKKPWTMCYWGGRPTEDWMFSTAYAADAKWNDSYWKHDRFNELLLSARAELDENKRRTAYYEMQEIVSNEGGVIVPMYASYVTATSKKIKVSDPIAANWDLDGHRYTERWSFA